MIALLLFSLLLLTSTALFARGMRRARQGGYERGRTFLVAGYLLAAALSAELLFLISGVGR